MAFRANTIAAMHGEQPLLRGLVDSGRKVLAGMLFMLPGVLSDLIALVLLALPLNLGREFGRSRDAARRAGDRREYRAKRSTAELSSHVRSTASASAPVAPRSSRAAAQPHFILSSSVGCGLSARRYDHSIIAAPIAIIGSDSHWPIVRPSAR